MSVSVFVPGHITGFFNIENNANPLINGSCGAGFLLSKGVETTIKYSDNDETSIKINGKIDLKNETIIHEVLKIMNIDVGLEISQKISLPIGAGFGTSAASALGISLCLDKLLNLNNGIEKSGQIAHLAEVKLNSGLGDVIGELGKGIVIRTKPGAPGFGEIKSYIRKDIYIGCKTFSQIKTSNIIQNENYKKTINKYGKQAGNNFNEEYPLESFLKESYEFSRKIDLMNKDVKNKVNMLNNNFDILGSSMAMLGNTVFAFSDNKKSLKESNLEIYKLNNTGIEL